MAIVYITVIVQCVWKLYAFLFLYVVLFLKINLTTCENFHFNNLMSV